MQDSEATGIFYAIVISQGICTANAVPSRIDDVAKNLFYQESA